MIPSLRDTQLLTAMIRELGSLTLGEASDWRNCDDKLGRSAYSPCKSRLLVYNRMLLIKCNSFGWGEWLLFVHLECTQDVTMGDVLLPIAVHWPTVV